MPIDSSMRGRASGLTGRRRECSILDQLIEAVRLGERRVLVVRGELGAGKTVLLDYLAGRADDCRVARVAGAQSEMELAFAGLHQLCGPVLDRLEHLPVPQRDALQIAFGLSNGPAPDRFLVGLAVLGLLSETAGERPLVCIVDDQQWLDRASAQALGFVARRLAAEPVGLVFATRDLSEELTGLPELVVEGLREGDARSLLESALSGPLDSRVRDQVIAEARGNPLALLELPRGLTPAQLAGGFGLPATRSLSGRIEESFARQVRALPRSTQRFLQLAAADPSGDTLLVWRAAGKLGIPVQVATPAVAAALVEFGARVRFRHPLARSAAYRSASRRQRQQIHAALAEVTDSGADPDRRAWHRSQAAADPDEDVAAELEGSAGRAQARGGLAAAAAFLEQAALLTPDRVRRAQRLLAAARAKRDAGSLDAALELLVAAEAGPLNALLAAQLEHLRGQVALDQMRGGDAARLLLSAARAFEPVNPALARATHLEALGAALWAGDVDWPGGVREAAATARAAPPGPQPPRAADVLLDAVALRFTEGYAAAAPALTGALEMLLAWGANPGEAGRQFWLAAGRSSGVIALEVWDFESWHTLHAGQVQAARDTGALVHLQFTLNYLARVHILAGETAEAARLVEEDRLIAEATGNPPIEHAAMMLAAWQGRKREAADLISAISQEGIARGVGGLVDWAIYASAVLYNGLGRHGTACDAARHAFERDATWEHDPAMYGLYGSLIVPELAEAASRTGDARLLQATLEWLSERTRVTRTDWLLGIKALVCALGSDAETAERCYQESIGHLGRTRVRAQLARAHLLYGEWLQRQGRRADARGQLRTAHEMLDAMGMTAFAERARRQLLAAGETVRKRSAQTAARNSNALTAQEALVARLARDGLSNPEIAARLFISARTAQYHLSKVFTKLGISSRSQLQQALPVDQVTGRPR
jgi:DNA-binding CsgD family transcriptional regulator